VLADSLELDPALLEQRTGWTLKPEGACKAEVCVPLTDDERMDLRAFAHRMGMPLVGNDAHGLWALGPETLTGRALTSARAPELTLPDLDGNEFSLSSLHGRKIILVAWASW
jgi:hypothetical protein